jgi:hypothetical protein
MDEHLSRWGGEWRREWGGKGERGCGQAGGYLGDGQCGAAKGQAHVLRCRGAPVRRPGRVKVRGDLEAAAGALAEDQGEDAGSERDESAKSAEKDDVGDGHDEHQAEPLLEDSVAKRVGGHAEHNVEATGDLCEEAGPKTTQPAERIQAGWAPTGATAIEQTVFPLHATEKNH